MKKSAAAAEMHRALSASSTLEWNTQQKGGCYCTDCICLPEPQESQELQELRDWEEPQKSRYSLAGTFTSVYSLIDQILMPGDSPLLEFTGKTANSFDTSLAGVTGEVMVLKSGAYIIAWAFDGIIAYPMPAPIPSRSLAIYRNGAPMPQNSAANYAIFSENNSTHKSQFTLVNVNAGDIFKLVNITNSPIAATSTLFGSRVPAVTAQMDFILLTRL